MSLAVTRDTLLREIGRFAGWGRNPSDWSENQQQDGQDILDRALRKFYEPDPLPGEEHAHRWSFLRPVWEFSTQANVSEYDLPDDFGGLTADLTYADTNTLALRLRKIPIERMLQLQQLDQESTGYPTRYAVNVLSSDGTTAQKHMLVVNPKPNGVYRIKGRYRSDPHNLTAGQPYPLGGQSMGSALLAAATCAADEVINDAYGGATWQLFVTRMRTAISLDRQENFAGNLGYNADPGMGSEGIERESDTFTVNGLTLTAGQTYFD